MTLGFVIVRHVNSIITNCYWKHSYNYIRKFYPENPILIVDDNSNPDFLDTMEMTNIQVVESEFPKRGEILGYYYFLQTKFADIAVIIHDSVFINCWIDFEKYEGTTLWSFKHDWDEDQATIGLINKLSNNKNILDKYINKNSWGGCFGAMSVVSWDFVKMVDQTYNYFQALFPVTTSRGVRCLHERIWACILSIHYPNNNKDIICDIHIQGWGSTFNDHVLGKLQHKKIIKVWTGR